MTLSVALIKVSNEWMDKWITNWKGCGRKQSWSNLRYYPGICLEGLRKTTNKPQSVTRLRFEPGRYQIQSRSVINLTTTFSRWWWRW
jgi:hypothetical protein